METVTLAKMVGALSGLGGMLRLYRSESHRLRAEIDSNRDFADRFPEGSVARAKLHQFGDLLVDVYIAKGVARVQTKREWGAVVLDVVAISALGYWLMEVTSPWLKGALYCAIAVLGISLFGLLFPSKKSKNSSPAPTQGPAVQDPQPLPTPRETSESEIGEQMEAAPPGR